MDLSAVLDERQTIGVFSLPVNVECVLGLHAHLDDVLVRLQRRPPALLWGHLYWRRPCRRPGPGAAQSVAVPIWTSPKGRQDASDA